MEQIVALGADQASKGREASEKEQRKASQQMVLPAPGEYNEGTPASLVELDLVRTGVYKW